MLMVCVLSAHAQWKVTPEAGINVTKYQHYGPKVGYKVGAAVSYKFDNQWFLQSGLYFVQRGIPYSQIYEIYGTVEGVEGKREEASFFLLPDSKQPIYREKLHNGVIQGGYGNNGGYGSYENGYIMSFKNMDVDGVRTSYNSAHRGYIQLPIMAGYQWNLSENVRLSVSAGPYMAIGLTGKFQYGEHDFSFKGKLPKHWSVSYNPFHGDGKILPNGGVYQSCKRFDWGLTANVTLEVNRFTLRMGYDLGLGAETDYMNSGVNPKFHTFSFTLGYAF